MYVGALSPAEKEISEAGLRSSDAFTLRRSQILLASSRKQRPKTIAHNLGCATQTVRNAIHAFEQKGLACLKQESSRPKTVQAQFDQTKCEGLRALLHQSPRTFGKPTSVWTLALAAQVCQEVGLTTSQVSIETIRLADPPSWDWVAEGERLDDLDPLFWGKLKHRIHYHYQKCVRLVLHKARGSTIIHGHNINYTAVWDTAFTYTSRTRVGSHRGAPSVGLGSLTDFT